MNSALQATYSTRAHPHSLLHSLTIRFPIAFSCAYTSQIHQWPDELSIVGIDSYDASLEWAMCIGWVTQMCIRHLIITITTPQHNNQCHIDSLRRLLYTLTVSVMWLQYIKIKSYMEVWRLGDGGGERYRKIKRHEVERGWTKAVECCGLRY